MWGQLSTSCSNVLKQPNGELLVAVNHNQLRIMASETVDPIDRSHPPPSWAVPLERLVQRINQCDLLLCRRSLMTVIYWEWHLNPIWLLRSDFAWFPVQLLKGLLSWRSPGEYSIIDCFLGYAFVVLDGPFWSTTLQCGKRLQIHNLIKLLDRVVSGASFLTGGGFECDLAHRRSVSILWKRFTIMVQLDEPSLWYPT